MRKASPFYPAEPKGDFRKDFSTERDRTRDELRVIAPFRGLVKRADGDDEDDKPLLPVDTIHLAGRFQGQRFGNDWRWMDYVQAFAPAMGNSGRVNALGSLPVSHYELLNRIQIALMDTFRLASLINAMNRAPTALRLVSGGTIAENSTNGTLVAIFAGSDPNVNDRLSYSLVDDAGGRFAIHAITGVVTVANGNLLDFESASSHNITVKVTDLGGLTYQAVKIIQVLDIPNNEQFLGQSSDDHLTAGINLQAMYGLDGNDHLTGNSLDNMLVGGAGNDILDGQVGVDTLDGGSGNDVYIVDDPGDLYSTASQS